MHGDWRFLTSSMPIRGFTGSYGARIPARIATIVRKTRITNPMTADRLRSKARNMDFLRPKDGVNKLTGVDESGNTLIFSSTGFWDREKHTRHRQSG